MKRQVSVKKSTAEQRLITIVRKLPPDRVSQLIDFAQFLEIQLKKSTDQSLPDNPETEACIPTENDKWDTLLATDEAQQLLEKMADEAFHEIRAGRAKPMLFTENGQLLSE